MSTNTHGQSKTCTDIVNGHSWLNTVAAHVDRATLAARVSGKTFDTTAEWFAARDDARKAEDVLVGLLAQAAGRMSKDSAATVTLGRLGWSWSPVTCMWVAPPPPALPPTDPKPGAAVEQLEALGWRWSDWAPGEKAHWVEPAPGKIDPRNTEAAKVLENEGCVWDVTAGGWQQGKLNKNADAAETLQQLGYTWEGGEWQAAPAVVIAEHSSAVGLLQALGYTWQGMRGWKSPDPGKIDPRNTEAAKVLENEGCVWDAEAGVWQQRLTASDPVRYQAICSAARRVVTAARHGTGAQEAIRALEVALEDHDPGGWDAEALRDAAMAVLRASRCGKWGGEMGEGLERLSKAVGRAQ